VTMLAVDLEHRCHRFQVAGKIGREVLCCHHRSANVDSRESHTPSLRLPET
jgi:hypothetical protein